MVDKKKPTNYRIVEYHDQLGNSEPAIVAREYDNGVVDLSEISLAGSNAIARLGVPYGFGFRTWCEVNEKAPEVDTAVPESITAAQARVSAAQARQDMALVAFGEAATPAAATALDDARAELAAAQEELAAARAAAVKPPRSGRK